MKLKKILSAIAASAMLMSNLLPAAAFTVGEDSGAGEVKDVEVSDLGYGVTLEDVTVKYTDDTDHVMKTLTFDPTKGEVMPLVYSKFMGYGATVPDSAAAAEAAGYNVIAGVNASFFGLSAASANIYGGVCISDGIVATGNHTFPETEVLAFMPDGKAELVKSKLAYTFTAERDAMSAVVECINICPDYTYDVIYYYDRFCGTKTDTNTLGIEIVFEKISGSALTVGGELNGEVKDIRDGVSTGGAIGENEFVLYASETSEFAEMFRSFQKGDRITLSAEETVSASREIMENCISAFPTYGYVIVRDGKNVTASNGLGESYNTKRAQKTALGIKENGEMMFFSSAGREEEHPGITSYELADILIAEGCVTGINLDGGNSTQLVLKNDKGELETVSPVLRRVANSLLLVENKSPRQIRAEFDKALMKARGYFHTYEMGKGSDELIAVIDDVTYLTEDNYRSDKYIKATYLLNAAMDAVEKLSVKTGVYLAYEDTVMLKNSVDNARTIAEVPQGTTMTVEYASGEYAFTRFKGYYGWIKLDSIIGTGLKEKVELDLKAPQMLYRGQDLVFTWNTVKGVSGYSVKVTEYDNYSDGTADGVVLAEVVNADLQRFTVPAVSRTEGSYIVVEVSAEFPFVSVSEKVTVMTSALPFRDVPRDHWGYASAVHSFERGYITGVTAETFAPNVMVSRAMMATLVYRMAGSPEISSDARHGFDDVIPGAWYEDGVTWCRENEIVSGISETQFAPDAPVTREQAACFLMRYAILIGKDTDVGEDSLKDSFSDAESVSAFANKAVRWTVENGIIKGSYGRLDPLGTADRIQLAAILANFDSAIASGADRQ